MLALAMNPTAPVEPTQRVKVNTNKRTSEHPDSTTEMLALAPQPAPSKRPKLSLQTSSLPITFGKSSTALAMTASALPTASPTVLNTFNNAYDLPRRPSPSTTPSSTPRLAQRPPRTMASLVSRREDDWPYKVPLGIRGILRNTPIPASIRKSSVCSNSSSPRNGRRVFFPSTKRVCYRHPLEEEITTVKFVVRHSDLSSSDESESDSAPETVPEDLDDTLDPTTSDEDSRIQARPKKALKKYSHRQIRAAAVRDRLCDGYDPKAQSTTPSDRKKRRRWEWTLGPLDEEVAEQNTPDLAETLAASSSTTQTEAQASISQTEESSKAPAALTTHSPARPSASPSPILPQMIPLPESPAHAATEEGG
jgi:hypothetical protein